MVADKILRVVIEKVLPNVLPFGRAFKLIRYGSRLLKLS